MYLRILGLLKTNLFVSIDSHSCTKHPGVDSPCTVVFCSAQVLARILLRFFPLFALLVDNSFVASLTTPPASFPAVGRYKLAGAEFVLSNAGAKMSAVFSSGIRSGASGAASARYAFPHS